MNEYLQYDWSKLEGKVDKDNVELAFVVRRVEAA